MPDWLSHILIGLVFAELLNIDKKSLVVLGSLLPDFIAKIYLFSLFFPVNDILLFVTTLYHSPIMGLIIPGLVAPLFRYNRKKTYIYVMLGFMLHIIADSFTTGFNGGVMLYPFSHSFFSFNVFWANEFWIILVGSIIAYAIVKFAKHGLSIKSLFRI